MRTFVMILLQVVLALVLAGAIMPLLMFAVPSTRSLGPAAVAIVVGVLFVVLRVLWPRRLM